MRLTIFFALLLVLAGCDVHQAGAPSSARPKPPQAAPTRVEVGMSFAEFDKLCFTPEFPQTVKDDFKQIESGSGKSIHIRLVDDYKAAGRFRFARGCVGVFTFRDGILESKLQ